MDRIDRNDDALRVIDYKFKFGAKPATQDKNLLRAALRGERLQPPFYYMLAQHWAEEQLSSHRDRLSRRISITFRHAWAEGPLLSTSYGSAGLTDQLGAATKQTIAYLVDGVRQGRFFLNRGDYCGRCDAARSAAKTIRRACGASTTIRLRNLIGLYAGKIPRNYERRPKRISNYPTPATAKSPSPPSIATSWSPRERAPAKRRC